MDAAGDDALTPVATSNVGKYYVGQQVNGMGGGEVDGYIVRITPDEPGADGGPGVIEITNVHRHLLVRHDAKVRGPGCTLNLC